jgi:hypothetical protein
MVGNFDMGNFRALVFTLWNIDQFNGDYFNLATNNPINVYGISREVKKGTKRKKKVQKILILPKGSLLVKLQNNPCDSNG